MGDWFCPLLLLAVVMVVVVPMALSSTE
jgi:hypothetical protein